MSSPKHLWSGDWEQESAAAAQARANRGERAWPQAPEPAPEPESRNPAASRRASPPPPPPRGPRAQRRIALPRPRVAILSVVALLLLAGAAYGLTSLGERANTPPHGVAWLGARLESWPAGGAVIARVEPGSPAASAGLKAGDVVIQVQGRPVTSPYNVTSAIGALNAGDRLQLLVVRGGRTVPMAATLGARPPDAP